MMMFLEGLLVIYGGLYGIYGLQIIRSKDGDQTPGMMCSPGTLIVREDETHSMYCAKNLIDAGCDLRFSDSEKIKYVESISVLNGDHYQIQPPRESESFCKIGEDVKLDLLLQDYPNNLQAPVWYAGYGVSKVMKSIDYEIVASNKITFRVSQVWPGLLLKILVKCNNKTHVEPVSRKSQRRCVVLKNIGLTPYPLARYSFIPPVITTAAPIITTDENERFISKLLTIATALSAETSAYVYIPNATQLIGDPSNLKEVGNEEIIFAIMTAGGAVFLVACVCITIMVIVTIRRGQKRNDNVENGEIVGNDNAGMTLNPENVTETVEDGTEKAKTGLEMENEEEQSMKEDYYLSTAEENSEENIDDVKKNEIFHVGQKKKKRFKFLRTNRRSKKEEKNFSTFSPILSVQSARTTTRSDTDGMEFEGTGTNVTNETNNRADESPKLQKSETQTETSLENDWNNKNIGSNNSTRKLSLTIDSTIPSTYTVAQENILQKFAVQYNAFSDSEDVNIYAHVMSPKSSLGGYTPKATRDEQRQKNNYIDDYIPNYRAGSTRQTDMSSTSALNETYVVQYADESYNDETANLSESIEAMFDLDDTVIENNSSPNDPNLDDSPDEERDEFI